MAEFATTEDELNGGTSPVGAVFDASGKVIVPPKYRVVNINGRIELSELTPYGDIGHGVMNLKGEWIEPMVYPSRNFNSAVWHYSDMPDERKLQFAWFLKDYDLIGMERSSVYKLLGAGYDSGGQAVFSFSRGFGYAKSNSGFVIEFLDNKVKRWRLSQGGENQRWYSENMIFRPNAVPANNLVPKRMYEKL